MRILHPIALTVFCSTLLLNSRHGLAQFTQQGPKLVGIDAEGNSHQGIAVALSADGSTAIVGGNSVLDFNVTGPPGGAGAAWAWTRSNGGLWAQQGSKLVGSDGSSYALQGSSVSLSADGNTAIVGGPADNGVAGAAWVWTRSGGIWTQQGTKLVGSDAVGIGDQGVSVSLGADGNTAIIGGAGAAWIWARSGGVWTQQGTKLVGSGAVGNAAQGLSVSMSADGNTAVVGGPLDNGQAGAAWIWIRSGGLWTQQGPKLVGSGAAGIGEQGRSVSLSADGNTAIIGGFGAAWIWTRSGGAWTQQGPKLVGLGAVGNAAEGLSVSLSADGNTAVVGGPLDSSQAGAVWVWARSGGTWSQQFTKLAGTGSIGNAQQGYSVSLSADGSTLIAGGPSDNSNAGAAWVFVVSSVVNPASIPTASVWKFMALVAMLALLGAMRTRN